MFKSPIFLQTGQTVGIVAPAGKISTSLEPALAKIESWGLKTVLGKHVSDQYFQFAGTDTQRITDFQDMLDNIWDNVLTTSH